MSPDYRLVRAEAQRLANQTGYDYGVEFNALFKTYSFKMLPRRENRCGHELRVEVVSCDDIHRCKPGHGPT